MQQLENNLNQTVRAGRLVKSALPDYPELKLYLLSPDYPRERLPNEDVLAIINEPAYWAFCWASGQVLARYIRQHPDDFSGKTILDFGAGSGVVGIAAALAGAKEVIACDIDPMALDACRENAKLNNVKLRFLENFDSLAGDVDMIIAADVLYDRENLPLVHRFLEKSDEVLIADSRLKQMEPPGYEVLGRIHATTLPDLDENPEFSDVKIYRYGRA